MESVNTTKAGSSREMRHDHHQSSRKRRKITFIITSVVIFSLIIGSIVTVLSILKHETEAEGLSANPRKAIPVVCSLTPYSRSCTESLLENLNSYPYKSNTINPTKIFTLSLHAAMKGIKDLISTVKGEILKTKDSRTLKALKHCISFLDESMKLVNNTMELMDQFDSEENVFKEDKFMIRVLPGWMTNATENINKCLTEMNITGDKDDDEGMRMRREIEMKIQWICRPSMVNSLTILVKMEEILELFDPRLGSVLSGLLLEARGYAFIVGVFCSQYLLLIILIVILLRL